MTTGLVACIKDKLMENIMFTYAIYLFAGMLAGLCAGLILAVGIQSYREKREKFKDVRWPG